MEQIIKKAIEGGWDKRNAEIDIGQVTSIMHFVNEIAILDPLFWQALGKACGWNDENSWKVVDGVGYKIDMESGEGVPVWQYYALRFHEINLTEGWDKAITWLEELLTKERN